MKGSLILTRMIDIPVYLLLLQSSPVDCKIVIPYFNCIDEYNWRKKRKHITISITKNNLVSLKQMVGDKLDIVTRPDRFKEIMKNSSFCVARGVEYAIFKPLCNKNIALDGSRVYIPRLLKVLPYYNDSLKIFLQSENWLNQDICKNWQMGDSNYDVIKNFNSNFDIAATITSYYDILKNINKDEVKDKLGIPKNKKIAFVSLRKADKACTFYQDDQEFESSTIEMLKKFKEKGYFVISRRRISVYDINVVRRNSPENKNYEKFKEYIDLECNGYEVYPPEVYLLPYISDVVLLSDFTGLAIIEAAITRKPCFMPYKNDEKTKNLLAKESTNPMFRDYFNRGLVTNSFDENYIKHYHNNIENFVNDWYYGNVKTFWQKAIDYVRS